MTITTRLTKRFGIQHPIVLAPMTPASRGALASAETRPSRSWVSGTARDDSNCSAGQ
ncbi:MAG TPA: hypothetical protein VK148_30755 [Xanthobacteraceae bacterium]|nr:hypothetical protein [Xanthobacteraceae bacterium]